MTEKLLIVGNGNICTQDSSNPWIANGAVCAINGVIREVGESAMLRNTYPAAEYVDARGGVIMPGLINAHNHAYSAFARGLYRPGIAPLNFIEILEGTWWTIDRKLTLPAVYYSALAYYIESIKNGVTTVIDHHAGYGSIAGSLPRIAEAARLLGIRACLSYEVSDRDGSEKTDCAIRENIEFANWVSRENDNLLGALVGLHASFTLSDATLAACRRANASGLGYHVHVAEGAWDFEQCKKVYGVSVVERLEREGILGRKTIAAHCIHVTDTDIAILRDTDTAVVHNPESNMGNAVGCPPVLDMMRRGVLVGLGTDGYTNCMLESMKAANCLLKHESKNPSAAWTEVPKMLFENNREIAKRVFGVEVGTLKVGAQADIAVFDYRPFTPMRENNANSHILFGMAGRQATDVVVQGKVVMKDRSLVGFDERSFEQKSQEAARTLWNAL